MSPLPNRPKFFESLSGFHIISYFQILFQTFIGRPCFFVPPEGNEWWPLFPPKHRLYPYHFSNYFRKSESHRLYLHAHFKRLLKEKHPLIGRFGEYVDFFVPVLFDGRCEGFLVSGPVAEKCPSPESLRTHWNYLTGADGSDLDPDFMHYASVALNTPILDKEGCNGYIRLMELLARWLTEREVPGIIQELNHLRVEVFSRRLPHPYWVDWAVGIDKFFAWREDEEIVPRWVKEEIGIGRAPTVVAALMPQKPTFHAGSLEILCQARNFQHECHFAVREVEESASHPLGDYGAIVLTSAKPGQTAFRARLEVREKIQALCKTLGLRLHTNIVASIGSLIPGGGNLARSYHEAVTSLHTAVESGRIVLFPESTTALRENMSLPKTRSLIRNLASALARSSPSRIAHASEHFINQLIYTGYGPEVSRAYMLSALHILLEQFEHRSGVGQSTAGAVGTTLMARLDSAYTLPDLVEAFKGAIHTLVQYQSKPKEASVATRMNSLIVDITRDPGRSWSLLALSKRAGLSPPTFLKWFKKTAGLPFGPYVRKMRLSKAMDLLREGNLTLERIAQECGFGSASTFSIIFRKAYGTSPRRYHSKDGDRK